MELRKKSDRIVEWDGDFAFRHTSQTVKYSTSDLIEKMKVIHNIQPWMSSLIAYVLGGIGELNINDISDWANADAIVEDLENTVCANNL